MVKYHTYTDRTVRYKNRCYKKFSSQCAYEISKRNAEISNLRRSNVDIANNLKRTVGSYNFIFKQYNDIYTSYTNVYSENQNIKIANQNLVNTNEVLYKKIEELNDTNDNLEKKYVDVSKERDSLKQKYNELLDEYVEDKIEKVFEDKSI